jgi:hypothetical protein
MLVELGLPLLERFGRKREIRDGMLRSPVGEPEGVRHILARGELDLGGQETGS